MVVVPAPAVDVVEPAVSGGAVVVDWANVVDVVGVDGCDPPLHPLTAPATMIATAALAVHEPLNLIRPAWHEGPREDVSMTSVSETEAAHLAEIEADLAELTGHVSTWISDRFLAAEDAPPLQLEDVVGLIGWLHQWHDHFDGYGEDAAALSAEGRPAMADRLAQIRVEIDNSIASFTEMGDALPPPGA